MPGFPNPSTKVAGPLIPTPFAYGGQGQGGDDTAAILAALAANGAVYLPIGYVFGVRSDAITLLRGQSIYGGNCGIYGYAMTPSELSTLKLLPGQPSGNMLTLPDGENGQKISDVFIDATAMVAGSTPVISIADGGIGQEARQRFERLVIEGAGAGIGGDGLYIGSNRRGVVTINIQSSLHNGAGIRSTGSDSEHYNPSVSGCSDINGAFAASGTTRLFGYNFYNNRTTGLYIANNAQTFVAMNGSCDTNDKHGVFISTGVVDCSFYGHRTHDNGALTNATYADVSVNALARFYGGGAQQSGAGANKVITNFQIATAMYAIIEGFTLSPASQITGTSAVQWTGGGANRKVTAATTMKPDQYLIAADSTGGTFLVTLPLPTQVAPGKVYRVTKVDASANTVTVNQASLLPAGAVTLASQGVTKGFVSDSFNWFAA